MDKIVSQGEVILDRNIVISLLQNTSLLSIMYYVSKKQLFWSKKNLPINSGRRKYHCTVGCTTN